MANKYWAAGVSGNWNSILSWSDFAIGTPAGALVPGAGDAAIFNAASGTVTATLDISPTVQTLTMTGFTGTLAFGTNTISLNSTGTVFTGVSTMTVTGTPQIILTNNSATTRTITPRASNEANSISFRITAGTGTLTLTAGIYRNLDFTDGTNPTGYAGALANAAPIIYGNFKASTGMTKTAGTGVFTFAATSGTKTIDTAAVVFDNPFTFDGVGGTFQLASALTSGATRTCTLTNGTLDLNNLTLTTGFFSSTNSNTRTLAFGTGKMVITGNNATVCTTSTGTALTVTGSRRVELSYGGGVGTRQISGATTATAIEGTNLLNYFVTAGTDIVLFAGARSYETVDFSDSGTSTFTGTWLNATTTTYVYGNLILNSTMLVDGGDEVVSMKATSGTKTITNANQTMDFPLNISGLGGTFACSDALTLGATRALTLVDGTLQLKSGTTNTVGSFATSGTNQKFLSATTPGTQATLSDASGTNSVSYLTIQDSNATGGAVFQAFTANFNVDAGNNTGWYFVNAIVEIATGTDTVTSIVAFFRSIQETATGTDAVVSLAAFGSVISEVVTGTDTLTTTANFGSSVTETAISADTLTAAAAFAASIVELATGTDSITARPPWDVINNTQNANWQGIGNTQTANWQDIGNTQTAAWTDVATT